MISLDGYTFLWYRDSKNMTETTDIQFCKLKY